MISSTPAASVIIPVFNGVPLLAQQLAALSQQVDAPPFEVVVVDNGSTDGTAALVDSWSVKIPHLRRVEATERQRPSHARNVGAGEARTPLLMFCDADDVVSATWVRDMHAHSADGDLLSGWLEFKQLNLGMEAPELETTLTVFFDYLPGIAGGNFAMSRETYLGLGGFDESLPWDEDVDLAWRAAEAGLHVVCVPAVVHCRLRSDARSAFRQSRDYSAASILLWERYRDRPLRPIGFRGSVVQLARLALGAPRLARRPLRRAWLGDLGGAVGAVQGHLRYRLLGTPPLPILIAQPHDVPDQR